MKKTLPVCEESSKPVADHLKHHMPGRLSLLHLRLVMDQRTFSKVSWQAPLLRAVPVSRRPLSINLRRSLACPLICNKDHQVSTSLQAHLSMLLLLATANILLASMVCSVLRSSIVFSH